MAATVYPDAIYNGGYTESSAAILLRIGNGGAGQSGLIEVLANAFIQDSVADGEAPFKVAWYESDTTVTINYLQAGTVDVGITYNEAAEKIAYLQGITTSLGYYAFREHFLIVGPPANPAKLSNDTDVLTMFAQLHATAEAATAEAAAIPVRFLSRYDKSATNIKESFLWLSIGQVPWATPYSIWYHQFVAFPIQALTAAILFQEYTVTDRGTFLSLPSYLTNQTAIYKEATDDANDLLLSPAHLLVGRKAADAGIADKFATWVTSARGQKVITDFKKNGQQLYTGAPATS